MRAAVVQVREGPIFGTLRPGAGADLIGLDLASTLGTHRVVVVRKEMAKSSWDPYHQVPLSP
jgi:hypothetical protein